ncbi:MAG: superoxide dismutase family protein, partial [Bdellovibrionales bacterium]|nr:superoxide dismutase family protein [Bdellovibrionales bacterium]
MRYPLSRRAICGPALLLASLAPLHCHAAEPRAAVASIHPTAGNTASGVATFIEHGDRVLVRARVTGLPPGEKLGFHIHQFGDCTAPDGTSAGGHFAPHDSPHAGPEAEKRHVGDLGNLEVNAKGVGEYEREDSHIALHGENSIIGRGVIIHSGTDDLTSQPTGNAGSRVACGVIGITKAGAMNIEKMAPIK